MLYVRYLPHSAQISTGLGVSAWINGIESLAINNGINLAEETTGSATDREFVASKDIAPTIALSTSDLTILSTVGFAGVPITPSPGMLIWGRELPQEALPTAIGTSDHLQFAVSDGLLVPVGVRASHNSKAVLSLMLHAILGHGGSSGSTPIVTSANQTITSGAGATQNIFTTGPVKFGSRLVQGIKDINVSFGIQVLKESDSGNVYPSFAAIVARMSKIEFTTSDVELASEVGDGVSISTFAAYFQKMTANGQRVAPATTSHIGISGTAGMVTPGSVNLSHKKSGEAAFTYTPVLNSTLIAISIAAAIPTS